MLAEAKGDTNDKYRCPMVDVRSISVMIAEDESVTRMGLKFTLETFPDVSLVAECSDGLSVILQALVTKPNIILMDIGLPKIDGITAAAKVKEVLPGTKIILFTNKEDTSLLRVALSAGFEGYCLKKMCGQDLHSAIRKVDAGKMFIAPELETAFLTMGAKTENQTNVNVLEQKAAAPEHEVGTVVSEAYEIEMVLGKGGMGMVYRGRHRATDRAVAIKILHPEFTNDPTVLRRFQQEADMLSKFCHTNLTSVSDFGRTKFGEPFMVMDFCRGKSLESVIGASGALDPQICLPLFLQVCSALQVIHAAGLVHRDVKPANIILSDDGEIKLVDFGLCKDTAIVERALKLTNTGEVLGSPSYMSPEQCLGKNLDARSDLYSVGMSLYEVLTGELPFQANSFYEMFKMQVQKEAPREPLIKAFVPAAIEEIILKCLAKSPDARYQSAEDLAQALRQASIGLQG